MYRELYKQKFVELRKKAEDTVAQGQSSAFPPVTGDITGLQHEVSVQQVELEMQHDELLRTHHALGELRLQAEREKRQYQQLFNIAPVGLLVLDDRGVIVKCNQAFTQMVNRAQGVLMGRTLAEFVAPRDRMNFDVLCKQEIKNRSGSRIDFCLSDKNGNTTLVRLRITPLDEEGARQKEFLMTLQEV